MDTDPPAPQHASAPVVQQLQPITCTYQTLLPPQTAPAPPAPPQPQRHRLVLPLGQTYKAMQSQSQSQKGWQPGPDQWVNVSLPSGTSTWGSQDPKLYQVQGGSSAAVGYSDTVLNKPTPVRPSGANTLTSTASLGATGQLIESSRRVVDTPMYRTDTPTSDMITTSMMEAGLFTTASPMSLGATVNFSQLLDTPPNANDNSLSVYTTQPNTTHQ